MRPIRIAVILDQKLTVGGGYQQELNSALLLRDLSIPNIDITYFTSVKENSYVLQKHGINATYLHLNLLSKIRIYIRGNIENAYLFRLFKFFFQRSILERKFKKYRIDLVYFTSPSDLVLGIDNLNFIYTVWDLAHRDEPEFPETRFDREFESRDKKLRRHLPKAVATIVDSEQGKLNAVNRYGLDHNRVHIIPFQAAIALRDDNYQDEMGFIDILEKYDLNHPYVFYPAQFWAHKNHTYILEGLKILEEKHGIPVNAIFSGSDKGNMPHVKNYAKSLGLIERVRFVGFVPNDEILRLYKQSLAVVMPSYFGPTNIPPLEAFKLGIPFLYSDKDGFREQVGESALFMDLKRPETLADHLKNLLVDSSLRERLIKSGKERSQRLESIEPIKVLESVIEDFRWRRLTWE